MKSNCKTILKQLIILFAVLTFSGMNTTLAQQVRLPDFLVKKNNEISAGHWDLPKKNDDMTAEKTKAIAAKLIRNIGIVDRFYILNNGLPKVGFLNFNYYKTKIASQLTSLGFDIEKPILETTVAKLCQTTEQLAARLKSLFEVEKMPVLKRREKSKELYAEFLYYSDLFQELEKNENTEITPDLKERHAQAQATAKKYYGFINANRN